MTAIAAKKLGYHTFLYCPKGDNPAEYSVNEYMFGNWNDDKKLEICARQISDRNYLYEKVENRILKENQKFEILKDLKEKSHDNQKSFIDWIKSTKPLIKNEGLNSEQDTLFDLFKDFSKRKTKVKKIKKEDYMTETLAELYIEQKKFKEALKAYEILSLKYPEKISLFADQIIFLKNKLKNV